MVYAVVCALALWLTSRLTLDGAIAAAIVGGTLWEITGFRLAGPLLTFALGSMLLERVLSRPERDHSDSRRATQVIANSGPALVCALLSWYLEDPRFVVAGSASLAAACADTFATAVGMRFGAEPRSLLSRRHVPVGTEGAVSAIGLAGAAIGATLVAFVFAIAGLNRSVLWIAAVGFVGCLVDSVLGELFQSKARGDRSFVRLSNDLVNLITTSFAAFLGYALSEI